MVLRASFNARAFAACVACINHFLAIFESLPMSAVILSSPSTSILFLRDTNAALNVESLGLFVALGSFYLGVLLVLLVVHLHRCSVLVWDVYYFVLLSSVSSFV